MSGIRFLNIYIYSYKIIFLFEFFSSKTFLKLVEAYNKNITPLIPKKSGVLSEIHSPSLAYLVYGLYI